MIICQRFFWVTKTMTVDFEGDWRCELVLQRMVVRVEVRVRAAIQQAVSARE